MRGCTLLHIVTATFFAGIVFMTLRGWQPYSSPMNIVGYSWLALFYTCCLLIAVARSSPFIDKLLCSSTLRGLGTLAYGVYLIHRPMIWEGRHFLTLTFPHSPVLIMVAGGILGVGVTILIAAVSWRFFESPLVHRGHRFRY